jgi:hypothetical protein
VVALAGAAALPARDERSRCSAHPSVAPNRERREGPDDATIQASEPARESGSPEPTAYQQRAAAFAEGDPVVTHLVSADLPTA